MVAAPAMTLPSPPGSASTHSHAVTDDEPLAWPQLPGAAPHAAELARSLHAALRARGPQYEPRTHHRGPEGAPLYTNRLIRETSPYLLQHAHNPVDWYPWGDEAFEVARREGRPVLLSIGYSTCHWCHVMEEESFEDVEIATALNQRYVAIKVDREERPDVDAVYMSAVQNLTGSGGWPMTVFLTATRAPFFAGTYFPPRDGARGARHGFLTILRELDRTFHAEPRRVEEAATALVDAVRADLEAAPGANAAALPSARAIQQTIATFKASYDRVHGGVRRAPKFPATLPNRLLLRYHRRTGDPEALEMVTRTLTAMAHGGIYDQIGGGFHRYSTDARWLVPHFEKMLYDNALLARTYVEAHQVTGRPDFARVALETLSYVLREMTAPEGGFFSATDADSEGEEGRFFVWSAAEIREVLGAEADRFARAYGVTEEGNFEGHNILTVTAADEAELAALAPARAALYDRRARRVPPLRDDKILTSWNGLMISALSVAGPVLDEPRFTAAAARAADYLLATVWRDQRLARSRKDTQPQGAAYLDDYAFFAAGLLDLFEATFDARWLRAARDVADALERHFADEKQGGWFFTGADAEKLLARHKPAYDGAEPSGTSVAILNALRLATFTDSPRYRTIAERALSGLGDRLLGNGAALTEALLALDYATDTPYEVAIVWPAEAPSSAAEPLLRELRRRFLPNRALVAAPEPAARALAAAVPFLADKVAQGGVATAFVCESGRCDLPVTRPDELEARLARARPYPNLTE